MKCLETRTLEDGLIVKTFEVPESVWNSIVQQGRMKDRLAQVMSLRSRAAVSCSCLPTPTPASKRART
jgi:hypothetical protein